MHRPDLIEQFGRERQLQLLQEANQRSHMRQAQSGVQAQQPKQELSFVTRLFAILRRQTAPSV